MDLRDFRHHQHCQAVAMSKHMFSPSCSCCSTRPSSAASSISLQSRGSAKDFVWDAYELSLFSDAQDNLPLTSRVPTKGAAQRRRRPATASSAIGLGPSKELSLHPSATQTTVKNASSFQWDSYELSLFAKAGEGDVSISARARSSSATGRRRRPRTAPDARPDERATRQETASSEQRQTDKEGFVAAARELARRERELLCERQQLVQERDQLAVKVQQLSQAAELVPRCPSYWRNRDIAATVAQRCLWPEGSAAMHALLRRTAMHSCCEGRDGSFAIGSVKTVRVWRVENPVLWRQYCNKASELTARHMSRGLSCPALQPPVSEHLVEVDLPNCLKRRSLDESLNEVYLWHGTRQLNVEHILQDGFDERVCSLTGMFGAGLYFAEDSCKSGQYAEKSISSSRSHFFFLSRVLLGRPHHTNQPMPEIRKAPDSFDSVVFSPTEDSPLGHHREFVVYDRYQAYPEYLVEACTCE